MNHCDRCRLDFEYEPEVHRCPGEWETICAEAGVPPLANPYAGMTWVEECIAKQRGRREG